MAYLFIVENNVAKPNTEVLLLEPFKTIWERDESENKSQAIKEFTFIEFMTSKKKTNPYAGLPDEDRLIVLNKAIMKDEEYQFDSQIEIAMSKIIEMQKEYSPTYSYYEAAKIASEKMKSFFLEFDINERNERNGNPIYKPSDITRALNETDKVLQNLNSMKEKVEQELFDTTKTRGNKQINPFEV